MTTAAGLETAAPAPPTFRVEQRGIDRVSAAERWGRPRDLFGMWAGASINFEYLIYGAVLMSFGVSFAQAAVLILVGNLSYVLVGVTSLQGPATGTTTFTITRASYGTRGARLLSWLNWLTLVGFETEGLALVVLAGMALASRAGLHVGAPGKVALVVAAAGLQTVLPFLGHATVVRTLRVLTVPFIALYVVLAALTAGHVRTGFVHHPAGWATLSVGLAFVIVLSGLGWAQCGNDYSRYLPADARRSSVVGWVTAGAAVPQVLLMLLGAAVATYVPSAGADPLGGFPRAFPGWFLAPFLLVAIAQLFAINSLDLYSSGVTLQAAGLRVRRWQAVIIDTVIAGGLTAYAVFSSSFSTLLTDFADMVVVWIGPWAAIFVTDWVLRRFRYDAAALQRTGAGGLYWGARGVHWAAVVAQLAGSVAATCCIDTPFFTGPASSALGGADLSVYAGVAVGALAYLILGRSTVQSQVQTGLE